MPSSPQHRLPAGGLTGFVILVSLPLMAFIAAVFVASLGQPRNSFVAERQGMGDSSVTNSPAPAFVQESHVESGRTNVQSRPAAQIPNASTNDPTVPLADKPTETPRVPQELPSERQESAKGAAGAGAPRSLLIEELSKETYSAL